MLDAAIARNAAAREELDRLSRNAGGPGAQPVDVAVTMNEVNDRHGTGPLVQRVFQDKRNVLSIRTRNDWGFQNFGDWQIRLSHQGRTRQQSYAAVLAALSGRKVRHVVCVPYLPDELVTSIVLRDSFRARLCAWVMDDQNVADHRISDALMREFLEKSHLRFATHPELRDAYQRKFALPFSILPAIVPSSLIARVVQEPSTQRIALLGSFWDQAWFDKLCDVLAHGVFAQSEAQVDWYGNNRSPWVRFPAEELRRARIQAHGVVPEPELAVELRKYPVVIVPVAAKIHDQSNPGVASLSLPGRILFAMAAAHTPILVMGSEETCGARFVRHFGIGEVVPYEYRAVQEAMDRLREPLRQKEIRERAAAAAAHFSDFGVADWLEQSIALGAPADARFEEAFAGYRTNSD